MRSASLLGIVCLSLAILSTPAQAKHHRRTAVTLASECNVTMPCEGGHYSARARKFIGIPFGMPLQQYTPQRSINQGVPVPSKGTVIGGRPSGCPHAYCGCSASLHVFGKIIPALNLAANWLRFPRTQPAPGMVAARRGHVFVLEQHIQGNIWLAHDGNSGHGLTRLHARSIAGYIVVNPRGGLNKLNKNGRGKPSPAISVLGRYIRPQGPQEEASSPPARCYWPRSGWRRRPPQPDRHRS